MTENGAMPDTLVLSWEALDGLVARLAEQTGRDFDLAAGTLGAVYGGGAIAGEDSRISSPDSLTVPANGTATLTLSVKAGLAHGTRVQGWITLTGGGDTYQLAYWAQVAP